MRAYSTVGPATDCRLVTAPRPPIVVVFMNVTAKVILRSLRPATCDNRVLLNFYSPSRRLQMPEVFEGTRLSPARLEAYYFQYGVTTYSLLMSASVAVPQ